MHSTRWTVRRLELGRHVVELAAPRLPPVRLEVYDGGGFVPSHAVWRIEGRVAAVLVAGSS